MTTYSDKILTPPPSPRGCPPTEPLSLQRQIDFIAKDTQRAIDTLNLRVDDIIADQEKHASKVANIIRDLSSRVAGHTDHSELYGVIHALRKRVEDLEDDRAAWAEDAVKAGAHLKFQKLEKRIDGQVDQLKVQINSLINSFMDLQAKYQGQQTQLSYLEVDVPGHLASDFDYFKKRVNELQRSIELLEQDHSAYAELEKRVDACWSGQEEVTLRVANYTKALETAVEAGDALLEKKIDKLRGEIGSLYDRVEMPEVFQNHITARIARLEMRFHKLEENVQDASVDPWKKRWDALKERFNPTTVDELAEYISYRYLKQIMDEMEASERS